MFHGGIILSVPLEEDLLGWGLWWDYTNPGYGLSLADALWNAGFYRQPLEQEGNPMT